MSLVIAVLSGPQGVGMTDLGADELIKRVGRDRSATEPADVAQAERVLKAQADFARLVVEEQLRTCTRFPLIAGIGCLVAPLAHLVGPVMPGFERAATVAWAQLALGLVLLVAGAGMALRRLWGLTLLLWAIRGTMGLVVLAGVVTYSIGAPGAPLAFRLFIGLVLAVLGGVLIFVLQHAAEFVRRPHLVERLS
jgi:hypothetical protein